LAAVDAGNVVSAGSADLTKAMINALLKAMWDNGALRNLSRTFIFVNAFQKQQISTLYGYAPEHRTIGGVNIQQIETDFGVLGVVLERDIPAAQLLVANLAVCVPVYNLVVDPETNQPKGILFSEKVPITTTNFKEHIYGEIGLDHGPGVWHGKITDLTTS
jgi:hypothetical protein